MKSFAFIGIVMLTFIFQSEGERFMQKHEWKNRVLIIKSPDKLNMEFEKQINEFLNADIDLAERKMAVYQISGSQYSLNNYLNPEMSFDWKEIPDDADLPLNEKDEFEVILIGLDGGVKLRQNVLLTLEKLYGIIDSMPMRRWEMKVKFK